MGETVVVKTMLIANVKLLQIDKCLLQNTKRLSLGALNRKERGIKSNSCGQLYI